MANIDKTKCIPCGFCFGSYSAVFQKGADDKAEVVNNGVLDEEQQKIYDEVKPMCPAEAIE